VAIEWNGVQREKFRIILQEFYIDYAELKMFVSEKLDANLPEITGERKLDLVIFELLEWASSPKGTGLNELLSKFCEGNNRTRISILAELKCQPLIPISVKVPEEEWGNLFRMFDTSDSAYMQIAFREAFKAVYDKNFLEICPDHPPMNSLGEIQYLLTRYDNPILAVRFVERAIAQFRLSSEFQDYDFSALEEWRDRITEQFHVPPVAPIPNQTANRHAYLLVALEESGSDVTVHPELRITGIENPVRFTASLPKTSISIDRVADWISKWIHEAEEFIATDICDNAKVTLEVFLPANYLEEDIATIAISTRMKSFTPSR
jgi:Effector-associated domain 1